MYLNLRDHQLKKYVVIHNLMATAHQKYIIDTHRHKRKKSKHNTEDSHQVTREKSKGERNKTPQKKKEKMNKKIKRENEQKRQ